MFARKQRSRLRLKKASTLSALAVAIITTTAIWTHSDPTESIASTGNDSAVTAVQMITPLKQTPAARPAVAKPQELSADIKPVATTADVVGLSAAELDIEPSREIAASPPEHTDVVTIAEAEISPSTLELAAVEASQLTTSTEATPAQPEKTNETKASAEPGALLWEMVEVKPGDSFAVIFERIGLGRSIWHPVSTSSTTAKKVLNRIKVGDVLEIGRHQDGSFAELMYAYSRTSTLHITQEADEIQVSTLEQPIKYEVAKAAGQIESSLFEAGQAAGMSDKLTMNLAHIFGWDIDFALDIRNGDRFSLIYENMYQNGDMIGTGNILAAEFVNNGRKIRAIRYTDSHGNSAYYTPEGKSLKAQFLRTPVDFARVSSRFNLRRKHPVLNRIRAHKGVDYAAARGTRIRSVGEGKIIHRGRKGGYGKTIIIEHHSGITTLYAHMNGYANGTAVGKRVRQGQTIGYVGSTGLATGPHLHYEFRVRGAHKDPLRVKLPGGAPLPKRQLEQFRKHSAPLLAELDEIGNTEVALSD